MRAVVDDRNERWPEDPRAGMGLDLLACIVGHVAIGAVKQLKQFCRSHHANSIRKSPAKPKRFPDQPLSVE